MKSSEKVQTEENKMIHKKVYCNLCGKEMIVDQVVSKQDYLFIQKKMEKIIQFGFVKVAMISGFKHLKFQLQEKNKQSYFRHTCDFDI